MMDDFLDASLDSMIGKRTWTASLGEAALPYALVALSLAALAEPVWAVTLFWASYAVGMRGDLTRPLPLGLTGWQEALLLGMIAIWAFGWRTVFTSWAAIFSIQAIDDLLDRKQDKMTGAGNWATRWGVVETGLAATMIIILLGYLDIAKLVLVFITGLLVVRVQQLGNRKEEKPCD
ncbi:MAG: hypothetical protein GX977_03915 [Firmicutes bacterium]|nr:hypothetical protein [Bacillota bacterium]